MNQILKTGIFKKLWDEQITMWKALAPAVKTGGINGVRSWAKLFYIPLVVFIIAIVVVWSILDDKPRPVRKRKHHGINKYGERY